ncbi:MAG: hypothetical protein JXQ99_14735 [Hyphomicrobiaceae bacterium]
MMKSEFENWLQEIGLGRFVGNFQYNGVDFDVVAELDETDLKELGLGVGYRRRFLKAVASLNGSAEHVAPPATLAVPPIPSAPMFVPPVTTPAPVPTIERHPPAEAPAPLSQPIALDLKGTPNATEAERRQVAVLFADLTGYTRLSAELDPEELQDIMAAFFRVADGAILANGGTIDKHLGDGVMAVFGAPVSHGDDTIRAVRAASEIHDGLLDVSAERGRTLSCHIGIASGEVLAGTETNQYTVIGDAVNLASRLSDLAKAHETFLSDEVYRAVVDETLCEERANVTVKGLEAAVTVWKVVGKRDTPLQRNLLPFVGREAERMQFEATIAAIPARGPARLSFCGVNPASERRDWRPSAWPLRLGRLSRRTMC